MKILSANQIRKADSYTIEHEPIESIDLMERASRKFSDWFINYFPKKGKVHVICGKGNNGGDGMAIARMLYAAGWDVHAYAIKPDIKMSEEFKMNFLAFNEVRSVTTINDKNDLAKINIDKKDFVIDAIFGSGLTRKIKGLYGQIIKLVNESQAYIISVDIPSGLYADRYSTSKYIIHARHCISFQLPKLSFFMPENGHFVSDFHVVDIGLDKDFIEQQKTDYFTIDKSEIKLLFKGRDKHAYKNKFGHALIIAGSYGKMGAAILATKACLRSGAGLVTAHIPECGYEIMQTSVPEVMVTADSSVKMIQHIPSENKKFSTIAAGPGLGTDKSTVEALKALLQNYDKPMILDADALNIISENPDFINLIPKKSILTPHPGEFKRLVGDWENDFERLKIQQNWSKEQQLILVLKGAYTSVSMPDGEVFFNTTGNPGMATAGSGDVLTGILAGMLSQNLSPENAAKAGVYIHGMAGDLANEKLNEISMAAGDLIDCLPDAFNHLIQ